MEKTHKIPGEITVRITLGFQDAPEVHTLLSMTPVRGRGKLVKLALERYIVETNHPAGKPEKQLENISQWLKERIKTSNDATKKIEFETIKSPPKIDLNHVVSSAQLVQQGSTSLTNLDTKYSDAEVNEASDSNETSTLSIGRWLDS